MKKYFKPTTARVSESEKTTIISQQSTATNDQEKSSMSQSQTDISSNFIATEVNITNLPSDPGLRCDIRDYNPNVRDQVRRTYLLKGPCQPREHDFPQRQFGEKQRRFVKSWFDEFPTWLEYSIAKDVVYCLCCYLFKPEIGDQSGGESFVGIGFSNWRKKDRFHIHVGGPNSAHNQAWGKCQDLMKQKQHIVTILESQSSKVRAAYRTHLNATTDCVRFLLKQGHAFRGDDESQDSSNQGNFLELLKFLADHNEDVRGVTFENAPQNIKLIAPSIQKDIVNAAACETIKLIIKDLDNAHFAVLVDEARDVSIKEQMAFVIRYVDKKGNVIERFLGIERIVDTSALSLIEAMKNLFCRHGLSISRLRGQGYDGASNMRGEFNGLKALVLNENRCAYYIHCFAHQLQLALVAVAKNHEQIGMLFYFLNKVVNVCGISCKRRDALREKEVERIIQALGSGELSSGTGKNQEINLQRAGDTRWSSHYRTLVSLMSMFDSVISVLEIISDEGSSAEQKADANILLVHLQSFEFVLSLHLMRSVLAITSELSLALQRKDQDIVNALTLVQLSKQRLQLMRDNGWESLFENVTAFCIKKEISVPNMTDQFVPQGKGRRKAPIMTNLHHYKVEVCYTVIDRQLGELNSRFTEANNDLLLCVSCLNPRNNFSSFDKEKLLHLAEFYPNEFSHHEKEILYDQLDTYIFDMRNSVEFSALNGLTELSKKMVEMGKDNLYPLVYLLLTLALILPVATATVERVFSAMNIVKNRLRNKMNDQWLNDSLVVYIERDIFAQVSNEQIMQHFQDMKSRRGQL